MTVSGPESGHPRRWQILAVLSLNVVIVVAANSGLNVALPSLVREYDASHAELQWIVDAYPLVFAPLLLTAAALGDRLGRKGVMQAGLIVYAAANVAAAFSHTPWHLAALRGVMGVGGAMVMPATLSLLTSAFPAAQRPKAIAVWAGFAGAGASIGPLASGALLEHFRVASVFWIQVPIAAAALALGALVVPTARDRSPRRLDLGGGLLSLIGVGLLVGGLIEAPERGWTDPVVLGCLAGAGLALAGFGRQQRHGRHPTLPLTRLRDRSLATASATMALLYLVIFGLFFIGASYFQFGLGYGPLRAGAASLPLALAVIVGAPLSDQLARRLPRGAVVAAGLTIAAAATAAFAGFDAYTSYPPIAAALAAFGFGMGTAVPSLTAAILQPFPDAEHGVGSALNDLSRELGGALGVAVMGSILATGYRASGHLQPDLYPAEAAAAAHRSVGQALLAAQHLPPELGRRLADAAREAFVDGMADVFVTATVILLIGAVLALLRLPSAPAPTPNATGAAEPATPSPPPGGTTG